MTSKQISRTILVSVLAATLAFSNQKASRAQSNILPDLQARVAAAVKAIEEKRKALGIPGISLVIVKDDKVIYQEGHGLKETEHKLPVTPETLFAIGSCTKAFTATAALMSVDEGKLSLDDSPRKYLSYFKLQDPDANARVTIRDLLSHRTGIDGTDIAWYTGVLSREEAIRNAGDAKPTAKLGEKFQYQNVMYSAAGEVVARAQGSTWEQVIASRFFKPLGMNASNTSTRETLKSSDHATGYKLENKNATKLQMRDLTNIAPAGAINSNARDMAQWMRFMLGGGVFQGKRLLSEKSFAELTTKQISMSPGGPGYALGWAVLDWHGHKVLTHSGGIDGFNSIVALMPDQKLGFVLLTNVSSSPLLGTAIEAVWVNLVGKPEAIAKSDKPADAPAPPVADPETEAGTYVMGGFSIEVAVRDGKLFATTEGQPEYPLINIGGRKYKLDAPAPDGFFMTFRPVKDRESETEVYLEQPQGSVVLTRKKASDVAAAGGSPPPANASTGISAGISVDDLMARVIEAAGGEANWRRHTSMVVTSINDLENHGITAEGIITSRAPNSMNNILTLMAMGKKLGTIREFFDGKEGGQESIFAPADRYTDNQLPDVKIASDFYPLLNWKTLFKTVMIKEKSKFDGEEVYVVVKTPEKGGPMTEYISTKSFLVLKRDLIRIGDPGEGSIPSTETYSDYRDVGGIKLPFITVTNQPGLGTVVTRLKEVKFDVTVADEVFKAKTQK